ncbi:type IV pilus twitching motility protein PilT [Holophaga foetida]|uniref:type IV pilus twitching motility protein PilT n=1 Tax=Holophaga foetida TaxID=35839 RepID=UPI00024749C2
MELEKVLAVAARVKGSDIHIKSGLVPTIRVDGHLRPIAHAASYTPEFVANTALSMMNERQLRVFEENREVNLSHTAPGLGRYRVSIYRERGSVAMVLRPISQEIPTLEELNLPPVLKKICREERGMILVTGTTGCGKSSTLAAMIDIINTHQTRNIITIEDPIEFLHQDKKSIISQREIGEDTPDYSTALLGALRQDPDVILVGEMRDLETIQTAMIAAETGHLVMATLHTLDAAEAINRIISVFPHSLQRQVRLQLASILKGVISQRLVPKADGKGRVPAVEIMLTSARVKECIDDMEKAKYLSEAIAQGASYGMQSFDQSLMRLHASQLITYKEALRQSSNPDNFSLKASGVSSTSDASMEGFVGAMVDRSQGTEKVEIEIEDRGRPRSRASRPWSSTPH